jgi:hypothetical protein
VAARFHQQLPYARRRMGPHLHRVRRGPGAGDASPGAAIWAMLCWEPGPRADGLSRGRRLGRTPPIDLPRNATGLAGVTRPSPATPPGRGSDQLNQGHLPWVVSLLVLATADPFRRVWTWPADARGGVRRVAGLDTR